MVHIVRDMNSYSNKLYVNNYISTGKYTLLSLIPKNLYEQFHRLANIWFLIVSSLQLLPNKSHIITH